MELAISIAPVYGVFGKSRSPVVGRYLGYSALSASLYTGYWQMDFGEMFAAMRNLLLFFSFPSIVTWT